MPVVVAPPTVVLARDRTPEAIRRLVRERELVRVGRGAYLPTPPASPGTDATGRTGPDATRSTTLARAVATHRRLTADHVFSHMTAAACWGLPLWDEPTTTHVLVRHGPSADRDPLVTRHQGLPPEAEVTVRAGLPVTTLERTLVDCARLLAPLPGMVVADAALRAGADRAAAAELLGRLIGHRGVVLARSILVLADDGAESPGESATRFVLLRDGWPIPTTQLEVDTRIGRFWTDLGWPELRLLLEYDGRTKYLSADDLAREKRRHDAIVETGSRLLRVTKEDLRGDSLTRRALAALPTSRRPTLHPRRELRG